jgi:hypothetical protein
VPLPPAPGRRSAILDDWAVVNMPGTGLPYSVPELHDNNDGWGPSTVPERLAGIPFAPFSKNDKLGKAADWTNQNYQKYSGEAPGARGGGAAAGVGGRRRRGGARAARSAARRRCAGRRAAAPIAGGRARPMPALT